MFTKVISQPNPLIEKGPVTTSTNLEVTDGSTVIAGETTQLNQLSESIPAAITPLIEVIVESPVVVGETPQPNQLPESIPAASTPLIEVIVESPVIAVETPQPNQSSESIIAANTPSLEVIVESPVIAEETLPPTAALSPEIPESEKPIEQVKPINNAISQKTIDKIRQKMAETSIETLITLTEDQIREMAGYSLQYWNNLKGRGFNFEELRQLVQLNLQELAKARAQKAARLELLRIKNLKVSQTSPDELVNRRLGDKLLAEYVTIVSTFFEVRLKDALNIVMEHPSSSLQKAKALVVELKNKCGNFLLHEEYMLNKMATSLAKLELFIEIIPVIKDLDGYDEDGEEQDFHDLVNIFNDIKKRLMKLIEIAYQEQTDRKINFIDEGTLMVGLLLKTLLTSHIEPAIDKEVHRLEDEQGITVGENEEESVEDRNLFMDANAKEGPDDEDEDDVANELQEEVGEVEARLSKPPKTYNELYEQLSLLLERIESRLTQVQDAIGN